MIRLITRITHEETLQQFQDVDLTSCLLFAFCDEEGNNTHIIAVVTPGELQWHVHFQSVLAKCVDVSETIVQEGVVTLLQYLHDRCVWRVVVTGISLESLPLPKFASLRKQIADSEVYALERQLQQSEVLFEDNSIVAINKPSGLLVHKTEIASRVPIAALQMVRDYVGHHVWSVHRLDRPTSGVLLFAKSSEMANELTNMFARKSVNKLYHAAVRGWSPDSGTENSAIRPKGEQDDALKAEQSALTQFETLQRIELPIPMSPFPTTRLSLVAVQPQTGRKHQIRRHMRRLNHHVLGDSSYGDGRYNALLKEYFGVFRLLLHASKVEFVHPETADNICIESPLPPVFSTIFPKSDHLEPA